MTKDVRATLAYLESLIPRDFHLELTAMTDACRVFNNPQHAYPVVHIAGTNGKGSTAAFLRTILEMNGYRAGVYTSPHLTSVTERIRINQQLIAEERLATWTRDIRDRLGDTALGFFEFLTLVAFLHFQCERVDVAIIETGLGGRLDATNVVLPVVTVVTPISFDHQKYLGNTLQEIAAEKCGIIKRGVPTVTAVQLPEVMDIIRHACDDAGSALCVAAPEEITTPLGLAGEHQRQNAACAVEAAALLAPAGFAVKDMEKALAATQWGGRLETVSKKPSILVDAAHNSAGSETLASYLGSHCVKENTVLLIGAFADKDVAGIVRPLIPKVREVVCVAAPSPRSASPKDLAAAARSFGAKVTVEDDAVQALKRLASTLKANETLVVTGSVSMVGMAKQYFSAKGK